MKCACTKCYHGVTIQYGDTLDIAGSGQGGGLRVLNRQFADCDLEQNHAVTVCCTQAFRSQVSAVWKQKSYFVIIKPVFKVNKTCKIRVIFFIAKEVCICLF